MPCAMIARPTGLGSTRFAQSVGPKPWVSASIMSRPSWLTSS
jgi:hypothetical protein